MFKTSIIYSICYLLVYIIEKSHLNIQMPLEVIKHLDILKQELNNAFEVKE